VCGCCLTFHLYYVNNTLHFGDGDDISTKQTTPLTVTHTERKDITIIYDVGNPGPGLG
jgi:hypothetical protein